MATKNQNIAMIELRNGAAEVDVFGKVTLNPTLSTRKVSVVTGIPRTTAQKTLRHNK